MRIALLVLAALATVVLDQTSKSIALARGGASMNPRGSLLGLSVRSAVTLWAAGLSWIVVVMALGPDLAPVALIGVGLSVGGAAANSIDRIVRGGVVDFVRLWRWPAFNLADASLVAGLALVVWSLV